MRIMITGATSGIGYQLAMAYAEKGHQVIACGRNQARLEELVSQSVNITSLCFDLTQYQNYPDLKESLDILIFNAGDCEYIDDSLNFDAKMFERVIKINLISVAYGLEKWLKHINKKGRLVLVSSSAALLPLPRAEAYGTSKAGLTYLSKTLAISLKEHEINVTTVHPGFVDTPLTQKNNFPMPMLINSKDAASKIIRGIDKEKSEINFPTVFVLLMKCFSFLPLSIWQRLASRMV
ncbi:short-chain dehydrogenase [Marinomonas sp. S3726]|uniref:SDR family NAD(P)-dependent oxidoreductase n=1 Tax=Marinomonas sp. S3726 TaxID=579484 RepID=UPI0005FA86DE|nr:SDR family NAD(P)-dependent oxidoreductase [Marinomonas sp. S3726]KJZ16253.1 short-chain dehydrogenase [Marinomonas sp. S3726]